MTNSSGELDGRAAWIVAVAAVAILTIAYGAPLIAVLAMKPIAAELQTQRSGAAAVGAFVYVGASVGGILAGWLAGRLGRPPRRDVRRGHDGRRPRPLRHQAACSSSMPATAS